MQRLHDQLDTFGEQKEGEGNGCKRELEMWSEEKAETRCERTCRPRACAN